MLPTLRLSRGIAAAPVSRRFLSSSVALRKAPKSSDYDDSPRNPVDIETLKSDVVWGGSETQTPFYAKESYLKLKETVIKSRDPPAVIDAKYTRSFRLGETYNPFDFTLTKVAMDDIAQKNVKMVDPFAKTGIDPMNLYLMPDILSKFLTSTGQIKSRFDTGLSRANQRKLTAAIRNARSLGLLSTVHRTPRYMPFRNM
ncbi:37S ribosomal protein RSM18, mitochondrial [Candida viswanathii]|uniref:Small ribosomal subunit protein bS18m n=1 Tax=Candida viswanathii TaxID=5486 RepID=A0A367XS02_9ASCO|nr:37S ribosomal protein RSM18, mitochondrial [Candida viswanathii]